MKRLKVLVSAFACHPPLEAGSPEEEKFLASGESILGWNIVNQVARFNETWVITQARNRPGIERAQKRGEAADVHFSYIDYKLWWKRLWHKSFTLHFYYYFWQWLAYFEARRLRRSVDFDLAQHATFANDWMPDYIGARLGLPFVWGPIGGGQRNPKGFGSEYGWVARLGERYRILSQELGRRFVRGRRQCVAHAGAILVCNEETRLKIPERHRGKVQYFPVTGINREDLHDPVLRTDGDGVFHLLTTGRLVRYKRFDFALRAVEAFSRRNPGTKILLEIVGEGPQGPALKSLARSLSLEDRVRFISWMPRQELIARMAACDVFLFPSLREGGGIVVIEAMACGKPVIALNSAGPGFHIQPEWGIKVEPHNPEQVVADLAAAMEKLGNDPDLRVRLGRAARRRAEDYYLWDRLGERLRDIHAEVLAKKTGGTERGMIFVIFLWFLIWGGMFTSIDALQTGVFLVSTKNLIQGIRSLFPLAALFICFIWIMKDRPRFPFRKNPLLFWYGYVAVGLVVSILLSPEPLTALYWAGIYLAPLMVVWYAIERRDPWASLRVLIYTNYFIFGLIALSLLPEALRVGWGNLPRFRQYTLALGIGQITTNGAGRYALTVLIILAVRFLLNRSRFRYLCIPAALPFLFLLTQTQSRTALLGLAVAAVLFIVMRGSDWRFIFVAPVVIMIIYTSGFQWRSHGSMDRLMSLTGREYTWQKGLNLIEKSPFLGWGFQADRIMMNSEHMHNSYLHAAIHTGVVGLTFFVAALVSLWWMVARTKVLQRAKYFTGERRILLFESVMIAGYLTSRSFFESTAAFYGVDLLLIIPAIAYIAVAAYHDPSEDLPLEETTPTCAS